MNTREDRMLPCVGCGYCCCRNRCAFSAALHPAAAPGPCPELLWTGQCYRCRLMMPEAEDSRFYRAELQAGAGCRSYPNPWRDVVRERTVAEMAAVHSGTPWPGTPGRGRTTL